MSAINVSGVTPASSKILMKIVTQSTCVQTNKQWGVEVDGRGTSSKGIHFHPNKLSWLKHGVFNLGDKGTNPSHGYNS